MAKAKDKAALYKVLRTLKHNGEVYDAGETVELSEDDAQALVAAKVIEPAPQPKADNQGDTQ
jgi:hypothetical protein